MNIKIPKLLNRPRNKNFSKQQSLKISKKKVKK